MEEWNSGIDGSGKKRSFAFICFLQYSNIPVIPTFQFSLRTMPIDFNKIPSPCYVIDELLLRNNLELIKQVKEAAEIDILVSFKAFSNWGVFPIFKEYGFGASASSLNEARLAFEELGVKAHTYSPAYEEKTYRRHFKI